MAIPEQLLSDAEIRHRLLSRSGWDYHKGAIHRCYETDGWRGSMLVANAIAFICESTNHHANLAITWPAVDVTLSTHSAGGVTELDFEVAALIERQVG
jgi:4a-hydroxytetrahydrobiopterin dehydratase